MNRVKINATSPLSLLAFCLLMMTPSITLAEKEAPKIEVKLEPHILKTVEFDRSDPPKETDIKAGDIVGLTVWFADVDMHFTYKWTTVRGRVTVRPTGMTVTASQTTTIYRPKDCDHYLVDHEQGHYQLADFAYRELAKSADIYARRASKQSFEGTSEEQATSRLNQDFVQRLRKPYFERMGELHKRYDELTRHGLNKEITAEQAVMQVIHGRPVPPSTRPSSTRPALPPRPRDRR